MNDDPGYVEGPSYQLYEFDEIFSLEAESSYTIQDFWSNKPTIDNSGKYLIFYDDNDIIYIVDSTNLDVVSKINSDGVNIYGGIDNILLFNDILIINTSLDCYSYSIADPKNPQYINSISESKGIPNILFYYDIVVNDDGYLFVIAFDDDLDVYRILIFDPVTFKLKRSFPILLETDGRTLFRPHIDVFSDVLFVFLDPMNDVKNRFITEIYNVSYVLSPRYLDTISLPFSKFNNITKYDDYYLYENHDSASIFKINQEKSIDTLFKETFIFDYSLYTPETIPYNFDNLLIFQKFIFDITDIENPYFVARLNEENREFLRSFRFGNSVYIWEVVSRDDDSNVTTEILRYSINN